MNLDRYEAITLHNILESRIVSLNDFIKTENYEARHGEMADAVRQADTRYLADIRTIQRKLDRTI